MSQKAVDHIIARMATDPGYHTQVQTDPATALAGFDLTDEERQLVSSLAPDHDVHAAPLAPRSSKSALFFGSALHDAAATPAHSAASAAAHSLSTAHAAAGASPIEQAVTWASAMDPGSADEEAELVGGATNLIEEAGQAPGAIEEELPTDLPTEGASPA